MCVGFDPALGPTLKKPYAILVRLVGRTTNTQERSRLLCSRREVSVPLRAASCKKWGIPLYHQTKQPTRNPINHSRGPGIADASFQPTTVAFSFKQTFSRLTSENLLWITSGLLPTLPGRYHETTMQQPATLSANQQYLL